MISISPPASEPGGNGCRLGTTDPFWRGIFSVILKAMKLRVAVDVQIPAQADIWLARVGFFVVVRADHAEPDAEWFARARVAKVEAVVTLDKEVRGWARGDGMEVVSWTEGLAGHRLTGQIRKELEAVYARKLAARRGPR